MDCGLYLGKVRYLGYGIFFLILKVLQISYCRKDIFVVRIRFCFVIILNFWCAVLGLFGSKRDIILEEKNRDFQSKSIWKLMFYKGGRYLVIVIKQCFFFLDLWLMDNVLIDL